MLPLTKRERKKWMNWLPCLGKFCDVEKDQLFADIIDRKYTKGGNGIERKV